MRPRCSLPCCELRESASSFDEYELLASSVSSSNSNPVIRDATNDFIEVFVFLPKPSLLLFVVYVCRLIFTCGFVSTSTSRRACSYYYVRYMKREAFLFLGFEIVF
jgi:hypothetical protein